MNLPLPQKKLASKSSALLGFTSSKVVNNLFKLGREIEEFSAKNKNSSSLIPSAPARNQFIDEATGVMHESLHESHQ